MRSVLAGGPQLSDPKSLLPFATAKGMVAQEFKAAAKDALSQTPIFGKLDDGSLDALTNLARRQSVGAGSVIFQKGDAGDSLYLILQGRVGINTFSPEGKEVFLNILEPGDVFGEIALLDGKERTAGAVAMRPTKLLRIARNDFLQFLRRHPEVAVRMIELLCDRLRWVSEIVEETVFLDIPSRLARRLLLLMKDYGVAEDGGTRLDIKLSQETLAQMLGVSRESVNKGLRSLQGQGIISYYYGKLIVLDESALRTLGERGRLD